MTDTATPGQCRIKGNIDRKGARIYRVPGGEWYDQTKFDPFNGERWFRYELEAKSARQRKALQ